MRRAAWVIAGFVACAARHEAPKPAAKPPPARLELRVDARDAHAVRALAHFTNGGSARLIFQDETLSALSDVAVLREGAWTPLDPKNAVAAECASDCTFRYTIDLQQVERSFESVVAVGPDAFVAPSPSWIAHPAPMPDGAFDIAIEGAEDPSEFFSRVPFATGLRRGARASTFTLPTRDYYEGSFAAFGHLRHRVVHASGATIEAVVVSDTPLALKEDEIATWIEDDAKCISQLYGHFPVPRATIFIVPIDGAEEVVFGKVLSLGGASIMALTGTRFGASNTHGDWVLVHEMTHLGFPTMGVRWLTEGLATYYEPILRTRIGWLTPRATWAALARSFPRGIPPEGADLALDKRDSIDDVYWGGALFVFMLDLEIRRLTSNQKSFDDVVRYVLARGGDATVSWSLDELVDAAKHATGTNALADFVERFAVKGERVDLAKLLADLGIKKGPERDFAILDDTAPLAALRRSIETGSR